MLEGSLPGARRSLCPWGLAPRKARRLDPGTWATELVGRVGVWGRAAGFLSGPVLWIWVGSYPPVCHFILQDCWSGSEWHVSVKWVSALV